jgi:aspartyl-tRNA(Asn)/glutamyl-tRNA(Gln) amidotransferase subunit B
MNYTLVIGLEIHLQLNTKSKMFCSCPNESEALANTNICPVCMGHPGVLPVINKEAVIKTIKTAMALDCQIADFSKFDRKNYFYPDLPKGYQISQYDKPLAENGFLELGENKIRIRRVHLEEDSGKLIHPSDKDYSLVDYNRVGTPLLELVTEPDIKSAGQAKDFCREIQLMARYLDISEANMEKGEMRCEVNISLMKAKKLGTKVEIKNLNSFQVVEKSIEYEIQRQAKLLEKGRPVVQETRGWDEEKGQTFSQRGKEEAHDYRYFPEPDLPPLVFDKDSPINIEEIRKSLLELPRAKRERFQREYGFNSEEVRILTDTKELADYVEKVISELRAWIYSLEGVEGTEEEIWQKNKKRLIKLVANWLINRLLALVHEKGIKFKEIKITPEDFAEFITFFHQGRISSRLGQILLGKMFTTGRDPSRIMDEESLEQVSDEKELIDIVEKVIKNNPDVVQDYKKGKVNVLKFLIGQAMKETGGRANPQMIEELLKKKLLGSS